MVHDRVGTIAIAGNYLQILHFEDPLHPLVGSSVDLGFSPRFLEAWNGIAVVGLGGAEGRIEVWDCRDPTALLHLSSIIPAEDGAYYDLTTFQSRMAIRGAGGYVGIYDLHNPDLPRMISSFHLPTEYSSRIAAMGNYLATVIDNELCIVDCSVPNEGTIVGRVGASYCMGLDVVGDRVFLTGLGKVEVFGLGDPTHPTLLGTIIPNGSWIYDMAVFGDTLYLATDRGVELWDIADTANPVLIGGSLGHGNSLVRSGRNLIVGNGTEVLVLETPCSAIGLPLDSAQTEFASRAPGAELSALLQPNPFNPRTTLSFELGWSGPVNIGVFDLRGMLMKPLFNGRLDQGRHSLVWDGRDQSGREAPSGTYLFRIEAGGGSCTRKAVLLK